MEYTVPVRGEVTSTVPPTTLVHSSSEGLFTIMERGTLASCLRIHPFSGKSRVVALCRYRARLKMITERHAFRTPNEYVLLAHLMSASASSAQISHFGAPTAVAHAMA